MFQMRTTTGILEGHTDDVWSVTFSPNGKIISSSDEQSIQVWDATTGDMAHFRDIQMLAYISQT